MTSSSPPSKSNECWQDGAKAYAEARVIESSDYHSLPLLVQFRTSPTGDWAPSQDFHDLDQATKYARNLVAAEREVQMRRHGANSRVLYSHSWSVGYPVGTNKA